MNIAHRKRVQSRLLLLAGLALLLAGGYALYVVFSPALKVIGLNPNDNATTRSIDKQEYNQNRLYIPAIDVNVPFGPSEDDLLDGAWWRKSANGNPQDGGNFVLAAHRFELGVTPRQTQQKSPFYHIAKLKTGDTIVVDYNNERYMYTITKKYSVAPTAVEIENRTTEPRLTLYSCTLGGSSDGRDVIIADLMDLR